MEKPQWVFDSPCGKRAKGKTLASEKMLTKLSSFLKYDSDLGNFIITTKRRGSKLQVGDILGCPNTAGYRVFGYQRTVWYVHQIVWLWHYGEFATNRLDHINGVRTDNRIANLREVSATLHTRNNKKQRNNTSGYTGVIWHAPSKHWYVYLGKKYLGCTKVKEEAIKIRKNYKERHPELGYTERHGK